MFDLNSIKVLHLEPTTVCNAACPQCAREDVTLYNDSSDRSSLDINKIEKALPNNFIQKLDKMFMCGDFGDPAATHETINIYRYFRKLNPTITLGMNTNGGVQNTTWWRSLGEILNQNKDYCVFSIDGLSDTNHLYRRNVKFSKVIDNAKAFIDAGGHAQWDMLIFKYNQHQIDQARDLAKELGFTHFRAKVSRRFKINPVDNLDPPDGFTLPNVLNPDSIDCHALKENSIYLAANGIVYPCCWIGTRAFNMSSDLLNLLDNNFKLLVDTWKENPYKICQRTCGVCKDNKTSFEAQWNINEVL